MNRPNKIGIIGSRRRDGPEDLLAIEAAFRVVYQVGDSIVSGGCPQGGDRFAEMIAKKNNVSIQIFPADWKRFGWSAGLTRNTDIAENSSMLIACVTIDRKGGTEDTIRKFRKFHPNGKVIVV